YPRCASGEVRLFKTAVLACSRSSRRSTDFVVRRLLEVGRCFMIDGLHAIDQSSRRFTGVSFRVARDSAGTQTGQPRIVSCARLVSTTIYPIWGLPINELYKSGPCRPLIRYRSEANLGVIFRSKVE